MISERHNLWDPSLFSKSLELYVDFINTVSIWEKICSFLDNFIWIGCFEFSLLQGKYYSSRVNVFQNECKISDITKKDFF